MGKKILKITAAMCDAVDTTQETLKGYDQVDITAAALFVSSRSRELINGMGVNVKADMVREVEPGTKIIVKNGDYTLGSSGAPERGSALMVNGRLTLEPDAGPALSGCSSVIVNGLLLYPESLSDAAAAVTVNGSAESYPDGAVVLKSTFTADEIFALRAHEGTYWARSTVIITDPKADPAGLAARGVRFSCRRAIVGKELLRDALPLFDDSTEIITVPQGCAFIKDDVTLDRGLIKKYGTRLFINGDLVIGDDGMALVEELEYASVRGSVYACREILNAVGERGFDCGELVETRGRVLRDKADMTVDGAMLETPVTLIDCAFITVDGAVTPELIRENLCLIGCAMVRCSPEQKSALEMVSRDVAEIGAERPEEPENGEDTVSRVKAAVYKL